MVLQGIGQTVGRTRSTAGCSRKRTGPANRGQCAYLITVGERRETNQPGAGIGMWCQRPWSVEALNLRIQKSDEINISEAAGKG